MGPAAPALGQAACDPFTAPVFGGTVPTPGDVLGAGIGDHQLSADEIYTYIDAVDAASGRVRTGSYGTTEQGRDLTYAVVGPVADITDQALADAADAIRTIQEPGTSDDAARALAETTRPFLFIAGNVHGNEESGADAAVKLLWHLADRTDCAARRIRDAATVVILPMQNPDGRELGYRRNANGFDMNRDGQVLTQPEIAGRWELLRRFPPQLFVDAHEFGYYRSFFPPNDDPIYHEASSPVLRWINGRLGPALADLFDEREWRYFNAGGYDFFAPIYGDTGPAFAFQAPGLTLETYSDAPIRLRMRKNFEQFWVLLRTAVDGRTNLLMSQHEAFQQAVREGQQGLLEPNRVWRPRSHLYQRVPDVRVRNYFLLPNGGDRWALQHVLHLLRGADVEDLPTRSRPAGAGLHAVRRSRARGHDPRGRVLDPGGPAAEALGPGDAERRHLRAGAPDLRHHRLEPAAARRHPRRLVGPRRDARRHAGGRRARPGVDARRAGRRRRRDLRVDARRVRLRGRPPAIVADGRRVGRAARVLAPPDIIGGALDDVDVLVMPSGGSISAIRRLGEDGVRELKRWVRNGGHFVGYRYGGTTLAPRIGMSSARIIDSPTGIDEGALVRIELEAGPLRAGVGRDAWTMFDDDDVLLASPGATTASYPGAARFDSSGLVLDLGRLPGSAAIVDEVFGDGRVTVFGADANYRSFTWGTQRILWNAMFGPTPHLERATPHALAAARGRGAVERRRDPGALAGLTRAPQPASARTPAVTTAATITTTSAGARRRIATAAAASPSARSSTTRVCPSAKVLTATNAPSNAGPASLTTPSRRGGSGRPPSRIGPAPFSAIVPSAVNSEHRDDRAHAAASRRPDRAAARAGTRGSPPRSGRPRA